MRSPNFATPSTAATVVVPPSVAPPGFAPSARETLPVKFASGLPSGPRTYTCTVSRIPRTPALTGWIRNLKVDQSMVAPSAPATCCSNGVPSSGKLWNIRTVSGLPFARVSVAERYLPVVGVVRNCTFASASGVALPASAIANWTAVGSCRWKVTFWRKAIGAPL